ncbi:MAG: hypothetical protein JNL13_09020 [Chitinophagaceae bacterium]|nr:hypothetical protein [Chitinophagaceae bacterium]
MVSLQANHICLPAMSICSRFLLCAVTLYGILVFASCATPYKPRGCGCGMEEHRRSR